MEIVVERIAKKNTYTIGRLYLLADGDVKRKVLSGKTAGDKRSFDHSFDLKKLSKDSYFCDTLEPTWRNLNGIALKPEEVNAKYSRQSGKVARKIPGHTAIPEGSYRVLVTLSPRFKEWLPYVQGVPGFEGIRIHAGNYPDDTQGCILVGENKVKGMVVNSRIWLTRLKKRIQAAENQGEGIWITIISNPIISFPRIVKSLQMVIPKIHGRDKTNTAIILTKLAFLSPHPHKSCANAMIFWNTAMIVESAANVINKKNKLPQMRPPDILIKTFGNVMKIKLGPAFTSTL